MNKIIDFDKNTSIITSEAGVILSDLNEYLKPYKCKDFDIEKTKWLGI
jgi:FAD/FMN-containing dehydrogenase